MTALDKAAGIVGGLGRFLPADVEILCIAHRIYADLADETMLRVAMLAPESARMHQLMAHEMARQAIKQYQEALKIDLRAPGLHFELAELYNNPTNPEAKEKAAKEYQAAVAENPFDEKAECRLGDIDLHRPTPRALLRTIRVPWNFSRMTWRPMSASPEHCQC